MNMKLNIEYIKKGSNSGEVFIPTKIENGIVKFSNGAQCTVKIFEQSFVEKNTVSDSVVPNIPNTPQIDYDDSDELLKIFNEYNVGKAVDPNIEAQLELLSKGELDNTPRAEEPSIIGDVNEDNTVTNVKLHTPSRYEITGDSYRVVGDNQPTQHHQHPLMQKNNQRPLNSSQKVVNEFDEIKEYEKVKLSDDISFNIELEIKLPKARYIEVIREMFEDNKVDYVDYMVKKYIHNNIKKDTKTLEKALINKINKWVDEELGNDTEHEDVVIKEEVKEKKPTGKEATRDIPTQKEATRTPVIDYTKIFEIEDEELYLKAKEDIVDITDTDLRGHINNLIMYYEEKNNIEENE